MRISEKTVELNICAQINQHIGQNILWFGLTQRQEARAGFDAAMQLNGRVFLFQFKASNTMIRSGAKRFRLEHRQLSNLIVRAHSLNRSVFYAFPLIGNTRELYMNHGDFLGTTWLLDVGTLPNPFPPPTSNTNPTQLRQDGKHYADVLPPNITIHSDPVHTILVQLNKVVENNFKGKDGIKFNTNNIEEIMEILEPFRQNFKMAVFI